MLTCVLFCVFSEEILAILQYQNEIEVNGMTLEKLIRDSCDLWEKAISHSLSSNCLIVKLWCQPLNQPHVISCPFIAQRTGMVCEVRNQPLSHIVFRASKFTNWRIVTCCTAHY